MNGLAIAPYGYKNINKEDGNTDIIVDEYEAHIVRKVFELYATGAYSMDLLRQKLKKDYGLDWSKGYVDQILNNSFLLWDMVVKGKSYPHRYPPLISKAFLNRYKQVKEGFNKKPFKYAGLALYLSRPYSLCCIAD